MRKYSPHYGGFASASSGVSTLAYVGVIILLVGGCHREPIGGFNATSQSNLKILGHMMQQYTQDHYNQLPLLTDWAEVEQCLRPYLGQDIDREAQFFNQPETGHHYVANLWLSGKNIAMIPHPDQVVLFYEDQAAPDGTRGFVVLDGHVGRVSEMQWLHQKKLSRIR